MPIDRRHISSLNEAIKGLAFDFLDEYGSDGMTITLRVSRNSREVKIEVTDYMKK